MRRHDIFLPCSRGLLLNPCILSQKVDLLRTKRSLGCLRSIDLFHPFFSFYLRPHKVFSCYKAASSVALPAIFPGVWVVHGDGVQEQVFDESFIADVAVDSVPVFLPVFIRHN